MKNTQIAWTHHTFNVAWGCWKISPGCANCYADSMAAFRGFDVWGKDAPRRTLSPAYWREPHKWNAEAEAAGERRRVFCSSMTDVCLDDPVIIAEVAKLWPLIRATPWLDWQLLTKRPERYPVTLPDDWGDGYPNVWVGATIESNPYVWRADHLRAVPATVRFVSYEPAIGPLDQLDLRGLDWIIYGGESGPALNRRAEDKQWARDMLARCEAETSRRRLAGDHTVCAFFHKQSNHFYTERGIELDGQIVRNYPGRRIALPERPEKKSTEAESNE